MENKRVNRSAWLGDFPEPDLIHHSVPVAAARMRARMFRFLSDQWIHPVKLMMGGKDVTAWIIALQQTKKAFVAPVADTTQAAIADRAVEDGWDPVGDEVNFRVFEPMTPQNRVSAGGPFLYWTQEEAETALLELLFEGGTLHLAKGKDGNLLDVAREVGDGVHERVRNRSSRYEGLVTDGMI
ncbi:MAG TPA: hypothetical protein VFH61_17125 [Thermoleophilia bacterium]|nr:hypothetical protein [Thermoleophilia bacterium]